MNEQHSLFNVFGTPPHKLVRRTDPDTSHEAAYAVDTTTLERLVLDAIRSYGEAGCISDELRRQYFREYSYSSITARYKALYDKGLIEIVGKRAGDSGRQQRIMRATNLLTSREQAGVGSCGTLDEN